MTSDRLGFLTPLLYISSLGLDALLYPISC